MDSHAIRTSLENCDLSQNNSQFCDQRLVWSGSSSKNRLMSATCYHELHGDPRNEMSVSALKKTSTSNLATIVGFLLVIVLMIVSASIALMRSETGDHRIHFVISI